MSCDLIESIFVWLKLTNYLVLSPITADHATGKFSIINSYKYVIYCIICTTFHVYLQCDRILIYVEIIGFQSFGITLFYIAVIVRVLSFLVRLITAYNTNRHVLLKIFRSIADVNNVLEDLGTKPTYKRLKIIIVFELVCIFFVQMYRTFLLYLFQQRFRIVQLFSTNLFYIYQIINFYNYLWIANNCLRSINTHLLRIEEMIDEKNETKLIRDVMKIKKCYEKVIEVVVMLNEVFSLQNLLYITCTFLETTQIVACLLKSLLDLQLFMQMTLFYRVIISGWPLILQLWLLFAMKSCGDLNSEVENTANIISSIRRRVRSEVPQGKVVVLIMFCGKFLIGVF